MCLKREIIKKYDLHSQLLTLFTERHVQSFKISTVTVMHPPFANTKSGRS